MSILPPLVQRVHALGIQCQQSIATKTFCFNHFDAFCVVITNGSLSTVLLRLSHMLQLWINQNLMVHHKIDKVSAARCLCSNQNSSNELNIEEKRRVHGDANCSVALQERWAVPDVCVSTKSEKGNRNRLASMGTEMVARKSCWSKIGSTFLCTMNVIGIVLNCLYSLSSWCTNGTDLSSWCSNLNHSLHTALMLLSCSFSQGHWSFSLSSCSLCSIAWAAQSIQPCPIFLMIPIWRNVNVCIIAWQWHRRVSFKMKQWRHSGGNLIMYLNMNARLSGSWNCQKCKKC